MIENKKKKSLPLAVRDMKILAHPVRLSILCDLIENGRMSAGEIVENNAKEASQSQVSQYLGILRNRGFIKAEKKGQNVYYTFSSPYIKSIIQILYKEYCA